MSWEKVTNTCDHKLPNRDATDYAEPLVLRCTECGKAYRLRFGSGGDYWEQVDTIVVRQLPS